jgi:hypothetical protein
MDVLLAISRGLLFFLNEKDEEMTALFARSFLTLNEQYLHNRSN